MLRCATLLLLATLLSACGKDPMAGRRKPGGDGVGAPIVGMTFATDAEKFDKGLVAGYEKLVRGREKKDRAAFDGGWSGAVDDEGAALWTESTNPQIVGIQYQFQREEIRGEEATLVVRERLEERVAKNPQGDISGTEVIVTATLVKTGGAWKVKALKAAWK